MIRLIGLNALVVAIVGGPLLAIDYFWDLKRRALAGFIVWLVITFIVYAWLLPRLGLETNQAIARQLY